MNLFRVFTQIGGLAPCAVAIGQASYRVEAIPHTNPTITSLSINDAGVVVGNGYEYSSGRMNSYCFVSTGGQVRDLTAFGHLAWSAGSVNARGDILGWGRGQDGTDTTLFWRSEVAQEIRSFAGTSFRGRAMNDDGLVVGQLERGDTSRTLATWRNGVFTDLGGVPGMPYIVPTGVNASGAIAGSYGPGNGSTRAFIRRGEVIEPLAQAPGALNQTGDINNHDQIVGYSGDYLGVIRATLWSNGSVFDLGSLGGNLSIASAINDSGVVVGWSDTTTSSETRGFVYRDGRMIDLSTMIASESGAWTITAAYDIAADGTIAAVARGIDGDRAVILRPVPEPASMAVLGLGLAAFRARRRRSR